MNVFFTGCTHYGHAKIISLAHRPFRTVEDMDDGMVDRWNSVVKSHDIVYHLGDVAWSMASFARAIGRLNGNIQFITGNHDSERRGMAPNRSVPYMSLGGYARQLILFHYPIEEWDGWYGGALHLHCHTHKPDLVSGPRRFNVGVDATNFTPISLDEILAHPNAGI